MLSYDNLLGLPYIEGKQDCYSIARRFYRQNFDIKLPNLARPNSFWKDPNLTLYDMYRDFGFEPVIDQRWEIGDALLIPIRSSFACHAAIIVEDNKVLHHLPGRLSNVEAMRPRWSSRALHVVRHPLVHEARKQSQETILLHEVVDAEIFRDPRYQNAVEQVSSNRS